MKRRNPINLLLMLL